MGDVSSIVFFRELSADDLITVFQSLVKFHDFTFQSLKQKNISEWTNNPWLNTTHKLSQADYTRRVHTLKRNTFGEETHPWNYIRRVYSVNEYTWRILAPVSTHSVYIFRKGTVPMRKTHPRDYTRRIYTPYRNIPGEFSPPWLHTAYTYSPKGYSWLEDSPSWLHTTCRYSV